MDVKDAIFARQSVRGYDPLKEVPEDIITRLLEAAVQAPTAGNRQPWRFIVVRSKALREKLSKAAKNQRQLLDAPVTIVVAIDKATAYQAYGERGLNLYAIQDTAAAIENMILLAVSEGLGTCWVGAFDEEAVAAVVSSAGEIKIVAMVTVGYPALKGEKPFRTPAKNLTTWL